MDNKEGGEMAGEEGEIPEKRKVKQRKCFNKDGVLTGQSYKPRFKSRLDLLVARCPQAS